MDEYKLIATEIGAVIQRIADTAFIPPAPDNTDCLRFLQNWKAGARVTDTDGDVIAYSDDAVRALGLEPPV